MNMPDISQYYPFLVALVLAVALVSLALVLIFIRNRIMLKRRDTVWLEITPPANIGKTPEATEHLFSVLHGLYAARSARRKLLRRLPLMSFEITSTKRNGIRYLVQAESTQIPTVKKAITAYIPDAKVQTVPAPIERNMTVIEFTQTKHYVLPITQSAAFEQHDPLSYITNAMTQLEDTEQLTMQLIVVPVRIRAAAQLSKRILGNEDILRRVQSGNTPFVTKASDILSGTLLGSADMIGEFYSGTTSSYGMQKTRTSNANFEQQVTRRQRPARTLSAFELELMETMHQKVTKPLFLVNLRICITSDKPQTHVAAFRSAFDAYSVPPYQELRMKTRLPIVNAYRERLATKRLPALFQRQGMVLSSSEVASLYHFPPSRLSKTDNLVTSLSRTLPAPISLKQSSKFDVIIGENEHHGTTTPIGLTERERERHVYVIGGTGNGKTTMLQYQIVQDMQNGKGLAVIDPHGDMTETVLRHVPPDRIKDVVYFNPDDLEYPIGLNLLELTPNLTGNELLREKDIITESVISVFRKIFSEEDTGGHRIEYVLRNTIQTALTVPDATLFTVFDLLNDTKYRKSVVKMLEDKNLINFWKNELGKAGDMQKVKMAAGITAKVGRFLFSASAKQILEQSKSTIDFDDIINSGKILICNFSKGLLGEDTSELFGITVLAKLQLASLRRARIQQTERRAFYLYVDEFQNFATQSFVQMLSESRKYKLFMIMAEQSTSQQKDQQMVNIILANVGTVICFKTGNPQDERMLLPLFSPYIEQGEISNLSAYNFYSKLSAVTSQEPLSGHTLLIKGGGSDKVAAKTIRFSQLSFARKQGDVQEQPTDTEKTPKQDMSTSDVLKETVKVPGD